jgi:hypothetical protein
MSFDPLGDGQAPLHVYHPMEIDSDDPNVQRIQHRFEIEFRVSNKERRKIDDFDAMSSFAQIPLQRLETNGEILVQRSDGNIPTGSEKREVDIPSISELEDGRCVKKK